MPTLTRRRDPHARQESWRVYFGDIRVGMIAQCVGNSDAAPKWQWRMGFYPGVEPDDQRTGSAPTFEAARADFDAAWHQLMPKLTEENFAACRRNRAFDDWKTMMWDCSCRLPTQELTGRSLCYCGALIDLKTTEAHIYAAHMTPV